MRDKKGRFVKGSTIGEEYRFKKGNISYNKGKIFSKEHRQELSLSHIGKDNHQTGKHRSKESKKKMRLAHIDIKLSEEHKQKIRLAHIGEKCNFWKGGITPINQLIRSSAKYEKWRTEVFERDNYTCQVCGDNSGGNLEAHHIKSFADYPELRFIVSNGMTLCKYPCHSKTDNYKNKKGVKILI